MSQYKLVYEKNKIIKGTYTGIPAEADAEVVNLNDYKDAGVKLVYERKGDICISTTGIPSAEDTIALTVAQLEGKEAPTPIGLEKMVNGDRINGIQIDCDKKEALNSFLANFGPAEPGDFGEPLIRVVWDPSSGTIVSVLGESMGIPINIISVIAKEDQYFYCPEPVSTMGKIIPAGWCRVDMIEEETPIFTEITGRIDILLEEPGNIELSDKVTDVINGVVFGEIKAGEPVPPGPTPPTPSYTKLAANDSTTTVQVSLDGNTWLSALQSIDFAEAAKTDEMIQYEEGVYQMAATFTTYEGGMPFPIAVMYVPAGTASFVGTFDSDLYFVLGPGDWMPIYSNLEFEMDGETVEAGVQSSFKNWGTQHGVTVNSETGVVTFDQESSFYNQTITTIGATFDTYLNGIVVGKPE